MAGRLAGVFGRSFDALSALTVRAYDSVRAYPNFTTSLLLTLVFFYPSLRAGGGTAGLLFTGDVLGYYWPTLAKMQDLLSGFHFWALDINLFNGSSEFYLPANFFGAHPLFVLLGLLSAPFPIGYFDVGWFLVFAVALESFFACYYLLMLAQRDFGLSFGTSVFAATFYVFGFSTIDALETPMFIFCFAMVAPCAYAMMRFQDRPSLCLLPWAALPALVMFLGGYIPLGLASALLALAIVAVRIFLFSPTCLASIDRVKRFALACIPVALASVVVAPFMLASYLYLAETPSPTRPDLFYSAHQLGDLPHMALRLLSSSLEVPGHDYVFPVHWGLVAVYIAVVFLLSPRASRNLTSDEWRLLKLLLAGYFATLLATFGSYSPISDAVYYFVPQIGGMHLYQRFLFAANVLLGLSLGVMLQGIVRSEATPVLRFGAIVSIAVFLAAGFAQAHFSAATESVGLGQALVFELLVVVILASVLLAPGQRFRFAAATVLVLLVPLNAMYERSRGNHDRATVAAQQPAMLDPQTQQAIVDYLKQYSDRDLVKYVDLTPLWAGSPEEFWDHHEEAFPKSFPYLVLKDLDLGSYGGFSFYLAPPADYMKVMPVRGQYELQPDWDYARRTGAEFVVLRSDALVSLIDAGLVSDDVEPFRLPDGVIITPLVAMDATRVLYENGYFQVSKAGGGATLTNLANGATARQSATIGGADAVRALDGDRNGAFASGSVTHTDEDPNAWIEIDLGASERIDEIRIFNRTDCCGARLDGAWVLVSNAPFEPSATPETVRSKAWRRLILGGAAEIRLPTRGIEGRYVRLQLGGSRPGGSHFLHVAEIEVLQENDPGPLSAGDPVLAAFESNGANHFTLETTSSEPVDVSWLLWSGRGLEFFLDGQVAEPTVVNGIATLVVPAGRHKVEVVYSNPVLLLFWLIYAAYGLSLVASAGVLALRRSLQPDHRSSQTSAAG
ncbi:discoidin domain-containing protein [Amorphus coralli]|uniref:galactose-binding domain-containing protein n=1 Tax=Amorphus coralli TaxID=340680 RepID=UPI0004768A9D|nr:discoidin domain-containing protein [Amorphus coralli]